MSVLAHPFGQVPLRAFSYFVALPVLIFYVLGVGVIVLVLMLMASDINRLEDAHDVSAMHAALDSFLNGLSSQVADEGTWDEAYLNVVINSDAAWMDGTWGATARLSQTYDNVFVTDGQGNIVFGENAVGGMTGNITALIPAAATMLHNLDRGIAATGDATTVSDFASDSAGPLGLAAVSIHKSANPGDASVPRANRRVLWIAKHVGPSMLQDISVRYQTPVAALVDTIGGSQLSLDLVDVDGNRIGTVAWNPDRPSDAAFNHALLIAAIAYLVIGAILLAGLRQMRLSILSRAAAATAAFERIDHRAQVEEAAAEAVDAPMPAGVAAPAAEAEAALNVLEGVFPGDFDIEYQPVFDLRAETLIGAEVLLRWRKRDGSVLVQENLSAAQAIALLDKVGLLAIRRAADEAAPLLGLPVSIAVTPEQVRNPVFAEKVAGTLAATNFPARRLQLSVNVGALPPVEICGLALANLKQTGVGLTLGDFLIGQNTIGFANAALADRVRLPPSVVAGIDGDPPRLALVEATLNVLKPVNFAVAVAGVSRKEEAAKLLRLGCREFQGALFAPPMPIAGLTQLILRPATRQAG